MANKQQRLTKSKSTVSSTPPLKRTSLTPTKKQNSSFSKRNQSSKTPITLLDYFKSKVSSPLPLPSSSLSPLPLQLQLPISPRSTIGRSSSSSPSVILISSSTSADSADSDIDSNSTSTTTATTTTTTSSINSSVNSNMKTRSNSKKNNNHNNNKKSNIKKNIHHDKNKGTSSTNTNSKSNSNVLSSNNKHMTRSRTGARNLTDANINDNTNGNGNLNANVIVRRTRSRKLPILNNTQPSRKTNTNGIHSIEKNNKIPNQTKKQSKKRPLDDGNDNAIDNGNGIGNSNSDSKLNVGKELEKEKKENNISRKKVKVSKSKDDDDDDTSTNNGRSTRFTTRQKESNSNENNTKIEIETNNTKLESETSKQMDTNETKKLTPTLTSASSTIPLLYPSSSSSIIPKKEQQDSTCMNKDFIPTPSIKIRTRTRSGTRTGTGTSSRIQSSHNLPQTNDLKHPPLRHDDDDNDVQHPLTLGLIRVYSSETTLSGLCTSLSQIRSSKSSSTSTSLVATAASKGENNNNTNGGDDDNLSTAPASVPVLPQIYSLFEGAVLGRNERNIKKNSKKMSLDIPINENGVSRKQLLVTTIQQQQQQQQSPLVALPPTNEQHLSHDSITAETKPSSLLTYLNHEQLSCPTVEITCALDASNPVRIVKTRLTQGNLRSLLKKVKNNASDGGVVSSSSSVNNGMNSDTIKASNVHHMVRQGKSCRLKVGDVIEFDAYNRQRNDNKRKSGNDVTKNKAKFIYRVVAFNSHTLDDLSPTETMMHSHSDALKQQRLQPSRHVKQILDKTVVKQLEEDDEVEYDLGSDLKGERIIAMEDEQSDVKAEQVVNDKYISNERSEQKQQEQPQLTSQPEQTPERNIEIEQKKVSGDSSLQQPNLLPYQDERVPDSKDVMEVADLETENDSRRQVSSTKQHESELHQEQKHTSDIIKKNNNLEEESEHDDSDHDDDYFNESLNMSQMSQDSFLGTPFESLLQRPKKENIPSEMTPMVSNSLWRALNSAQPQNGFGLLMHMGTAFNTIPNNTLTRNLSQFMLKGPISDGTLFKDYRRTELTCIYLEFVTKKLMQSDCRFKFNITPSSWAELEGILSLPLTQPKDISSNAMRSMSNLSTHHLAQALQLSSTSLKLICLSLELELKSALKCVDRTEMRSLSSTQPLAKLCRDNQVRQSLKVTVHLALRCLMQHGHWLLGYLNEGRRICESSDEERCATETKSCLSSLGSIVCHLTWLYCVEEEIEFGHDSCCFVIRDEILAELENLDYDRYNRSGKKINVATKRKLQASMKLRFILSLDTDFSEPLQLKLGKKLGLTTELSIIGL